MTNKDALYDWLFHYNHYTNLWTAIKRENVDKYFNGELKTPLSSRSHSTLVDIILRTGGSDKEIKKLLRGE